LVKDSVGMAVDLLVIRGNYWMGRWRTPGWVGVEILSEREEERKSR
jgi:hypothetical protein